MTDTRALIAAANDARARLRWLTRRLTAAEEDLRIAEAENARLRAELAQTRQATARLTAEHALCVTPLEFARHLATCTPTDPHADAHRTVLGGAA